jgi:hypothetical protein
MSNVKFIVPDTYPSQVGTTEGGKAIIENLPYDNAGEEVSVPEADAKHFDEKGWQRVEKAEKKK